MNRRYLFAALAAWVPALTTAACNPVQRLREALQESQEPVPEDQAEGPQLLVEVSPPQGISILLDGKRVSSASPWQSGNLTRGAHTLEVRGMGYMPMTLPLNLDQNQTLRVPVSLRVRPNLAYSHEADLPPVVDPVPRLVAPRGPPPPAPAGPGPELPSLVQPVVLHLACQPEAPVVLDGEPQSNKQLTLRRQSGSLQVGVLWFNYSINQSRVLEMWLPDDGSIWHRDSVVQKSGSTVRLTRGFTRLRREAADGTDQSVVLRRVD